MKQTQKITVQIEGMMCGMCEAHICDSIRRAIPEARKVSASHANGEATFLIDGSIDAAWLKKTSPKPATKCCPCVRSRMSKRGFSDSEGGRGIWKTSSK